MADDVSDDKVIALEHKRASRMRYLQYAGMLFLVSMLGLQYAPMSKALREALYPFAFYSMGACLVAMLIYRVAFVGLPSAAAKSERLIPRQIDEYQSRARIQWIYSLLLLLLAVAAISRAITNIDQGVRAHRLSADYGIAHDGAVLPALVAFCFIAYSLSFVVPIVWFRRAYNQTLKDELSRELRAKAIKVGYIVAISSLAAVFGALSVAAVNPLQLILWLLYANVALPILWYLALELRAGRSG